MKEFTVTIDRTVKQVRTISIKAESEHQAYDAAIDIAVDDEGWDGHEYDTKYDINLEEVPNNYIDKYGNPYDSESDACWPAGGGLHKDCEFNADALYAYYNKLVKVGLFARDSNLVKSPIRHTRYFLVTLHYTAISVP